MQWISGDIFVDISGGNTVIFTPTYWLFITPEKCCVSTNNGCGFFTTLPWMAMEFFVDIDKAEQSITSTGKEIDAKIEKLLKMKAFI